MDKMVATRMRGKCKVLKDFIKFTFSGGLGEPDLHSSLLKHRASETLYPYVASDGRYVRGRCSAGGCWGKPELQEGLVAHLAWATTFHPTRRKKHIPFLLPLGGPWQVLRSQERTGPQRRAGCQPPRSPLCSTSPASSLCGRRLLQTLLARRPGGADAWAEYCP